MLKYTLDFTLGRFISIMFYKKNMYFNFSLSADSLPHGQLGILSREQPHSGDVKHCVLYLILDPMFTGNLVQTSCP